MNLTLSEIQVGGGSLRLSLWGKNITDEEYLSNIEGNSADGSAIYGLRATVGDEATYGVTLKYNF